MSNLLEAGSAWLESQRHLHLTRTVKYQRGVLWVELPATIGRSEYEQTDEQGFVHRVHTRDFLLRASDLVLGGNPVLPKAGDRITETVEGRSFIYEVMTLGITPPWEYSDLYRRTLRVHTKLVATE